MAAYFLAAVVAFEASELVIHSVYTYRHVQGAAVHFAVMGAGVLGVLLGALLASRFRRHSSDAVARAT